MEKILFKVILLAFAALIMLPQAGFAQLDYDEEDNTLEESVEDGKSLEGLWLTENERAVIELSECMQGLCGEVYWITDGGLQYDQYNPDESMRNRPMCGLPILWGFEKDEPGRWEDGHIYKADEGDTYSANLTLMEDGRLKLRGYVGLSLFGKTQIWTPVSQGQYKPCAP